MKSALVLMTIVIVATAAFAQMQMPKPGPELKKLDYFVGHWNSEADVKPGPMGPGGKFHADDSMEWMQGGFFVVLHSKFSGAGWPSGSSTAYMGYDSKEKVYTYDEFNSMGEVVHSKGTVDGDTWTWTNDMDEGGHPMKGRFTEKIVSPTSYTYKYEMSSDGNDWKLVMEGKETKKTAAAKTEKTEKKM